MTTSNAAHPSPSFPHRSLPIGTRLLPAMRAGATLLLLIAVLVIWNDAPSMVKTVDYTGLRLMRLLSIIALFLAPPVLMGSELPLYEKTRAAIETQDMQKLVAIIRSQTQWSGADWDIVAAAVSKDFHQFGQQQIPLLAITVVASESWIDDGIERGGGMHSLRTAFADKLYQLLGLGASALGRNVSEEGDAFAIALSNNPRKEIMQLLNQAKALGGPQIQPYVQRALQEVDAIPRELAVSYFNPSYIESLTPAQRREFGVKGVANDQATRPQSSRSPGEATTGPASIPNPAHEVPASHPQFSAPAAEASRPPYRSQIVWAIGALILAFWIIARKSQQAR